MFIIYKYYYIIYYLYLFICLYYIIDKEIALIYFEQYFSNNLSKFCVESHKIFKIHIFFIKINP